MPTENLINLNTYRQQLIDAGFKEDKIIIKDISNVTNHGFYSKCLDNLNHSLVASVILQQVQRVIEKNIFPYISVIAIK